MQIRKKNLIMCTTPLQMLIAEKIIDLNYTFDFDLIVLAHSDNEKYQYYFTRLKKKCINCLYFINNQVGIKAFIRFKKEIKEYDLIYSYHSIYLASIDSRYLQYVVSQNHIANIYTFDDGTANVVSQSVYYSNTQPNIIKKIIWKGLGISYYMNDIKNMSLLHYTIYPDLPNIIQKTELIELYQNNKALIMPITKTIKFYLGQPLSEISNHYSEKYLQDIIKTLDIDYYFPHPREEHLPAFDKVTIINSEMIFEDYITHFLEGNPNIKVIIYGFTSSCILNLFNIDRVEAKYIYDDYSLDKFRDLYELANKKFNISIIKID